MTLDCTVILYPLLLVMLSSLLFVFFVLSCATGSPVAGDQSSLYTRSSWGCLMSPCPPGHYATCSSQQYCPLASCCFPTRNAWLAFSIKPSWNCVQKVLSLILLLLLPITILYCSSSDDLTNIISLPCFHLHLISMWPLTSANHVYLTNINY